jgi:hypothetical protein
MLYHFLTVFVQHCTVIEEILHSSVGIPEGHYLGIVRPFVTDFDKPGMGPCDCKVTSQSSAIVHIILSSVKLFDYVRLLLCFMQWDFQLIVKSVCILLKIDFHAFYTFWDYWHFVSLWNHAGILHWKWVPLVWQFYQLKLQTSRDSAVYIINLIKVSLFDTFVSETFGP